MSVSSHLTRFLECVVARSTMCRILVSASSGGLTSSGCSPTPGCSTTFTNRPLFKPPPHNQLVFLGDLWSRFCQVYIMNPASDDVFVAFLINFR